MAGMCTSPSCLPTSIPLYSGAVMPGNRSRLPCNVIARFFFPCPCSLVLSLHDLYQPAQPLPASSNQPAQPPPASSHRSPDLYQPRLSSRSDLYQPRLIGRSTFACVQFSSFTSGHNHRDLGYCRDNLSSPTIEPFCRYTGYFGSMIHLVCELSH